MAVTTLRIRRPDDWHVHLRDGEILRSVASFTARLYGRAVIMPNLVPPVATAADAAGYRKRILDAAGSVEFEPLMTAYLTDNTDAADLIAGFRAGTLFGAKLYPAGATTNADAGVTHIGNIANVLGEMEAAGMPLLVHGEVVGDEYDIFDREMLFIEHVLEPLIQRFPALRVVLEHITTKHAVEFIRAAGDNVAGTITPHHLMINRSAMFRGGIRPHMYCLPVAKREHHRVAIREAATSGEAKFFLGTDSAPHPEAAKETACGCAGIFNAPTALACYAQVFDEDDALERLEAFTSLNGPAFYRRPPNRDTVTLTRGDTPLQRPEPVGNQKIHVFLPDTPVYWRLADNVQSNNP